MFTITPKQAYAEILACTSKRLFPYFVGSPGIGKSHIVHEFAKDYRLKLIDIRLSQCTPEDLNGFPMRNGNKAAFVPFDTFPVEGDHPPKGYDGWLIFFDELSSAGKPTQAAAYKIILDRMVGNQKLHERVVMAGAGNKATDKAVVTQMSTALQSRMIHYEMVPSHSEFIDFGFKHGLDHRILSFISYMPSKLMDFRPDHHDKTFACPRTWEFLSRLIKDEDVDMKIAPRIAGTIGEGVATEFITFAREFERLPKLDAIQKDPLRTPIPPEISTKYATISMLIENQTPETLDDITDYVGRFDVEMQILFMKGIVARGVDVRTASPKYKEFARKLIRFIT
jgi:hypothetical protein